jgi:hypothetical protein
MLSSPHRRRLHHGAGRQADVIDEARCEFTNRVRSYATDEMLAFLDRQGIPFDIFRTQRQPMSIAHNKGETPFFAANIERAALRNS